MLPSIGLDSNGLQLTWRMHHDFELERDWHVIIVAATLNSSHLALDTVSAFSFRGEELTKAMAIYSDWTILDGKAIIL